MQLGNAPAQGTIALIVVTSLIVAFLTVFGKRVGERMLEILLKPFKWLSEILYTWIAPRNPLSLSLRSYKKHVGRSWLSKIENPIGPELDVPLEHAFAPLKLISSDTEETIDLFTHIAKSYRCIVLGGPGTGKTTLMKSLINSIINGRANERLNPVIPVFVVLRRLAAKQQTVEDAIVAAFADFHFPGAKKFVDSVLSQGRMLIILDGLDEVGVNREYVVGQIITFCERDDQQTEKNRVIVTCREYSYRSEDLRSVIKNVVRVEPFGNHHMRVFLQGWPSYKGRSALGLYGLIQRDRQIRDICRNPLLLTILTGLYLEAKDFKFPTSRNLFYRAAVDELITKRQARREIKQKFEAFEKLQTLQRASLARLETVRTDEDPEELTFETIREHATAVFRREIDFNEFIKELVEVNGIIKPSSDGVYTCAHRTIQEYFAANEADRIRTPKEVVYRFSYRQDLIEVLYFYCGLLNNVPQLTEIIQTFVSEKRWLEAARCLLNMREAPNGDYVDTVTSELQKQIAAGPEFKPALEVLSSLAQCPAPDFEIARKRFAAAIDNLAGGNEAVGASALESALATSPEAAMKVIPGLLKHESTRWQAAGVQLLKDIGTDESLDQLVQLLTEKNSYVRAEAAKALTALIKTRNRDLRDRSQLLPDRSDINIWPLEKVFPGRIAIPLAESLLESPEIGNLAIAQAVLALKTVKENRQKTDRKFLRSWRHVSRDIKLSAYKTRVGTLMVALGLIIPGLLILLLTGSYFWCNRHDQAAVIELKPLHVHEFELSLIRDVQSQAWAIRNDIEQRYPPKVSGWAGLWPSNWAPNVLVPQEGAAAYDNIKACSRARLDPYKLAVSRPELTGLSTLVSEDKVTAFQKAAETLRARLTPLHGGKYLVLAPDRLFFFFPGVLLICGCTVVALRYVFLREDPLSRVPYQRERSRPVRWMIGVTAILSVEYFVLVPRGNGLSSYQIALLMIVCACVIAGRFLRKARWPRNPLLRTVEDVLPSSGEIV